MVFFFLSFSGLKLLSSVSFCWLVLNSKHTLFPRLSVCFVCCPIKMERHRFRVWFAIGFFLFKKKSILLLLLLFLHDFWGGARLFFVSHALAICNWEVGKFASHFLYLLFSPYIDPPNIESNRYLHTYVAYIFG